MLAGSGILLLGKLLGLNWFSRAEASSWTGPSATPPGGNVDPPLNVGPTSQTKKGGLKIEGTLHASNRLKIPVGTDMYD